VADKILHAHQHTNTPTHQHTITQTHRKRQSPAHTAGLRKGKEEEAFSGQGGIRRKVDALYKFAYEYHDDEILHGAIKPNKVQIQSWSHKSDSICLRDAG
jgi:hypothetical protein